LVFRSSENRADNNEEAGNPYEQPLVLLEQVRTRSHVNAVGDLLQSLLDWLSDIQLLGINLHEGKWLGCKTTEGETLGSIALSTQNPASKRHA
jgi:hypothetical protein